MTPSWVVATHYPCTRTGHGVLGTMNNNPGSGDMYQPRVARGVRTGGQFAARQHAEVDLDELEPAGALDEAELEPAEAAASAMERFQDRQREAYRGPGIFLPEVWLDDPAQALLDKENESYQQWLSTGRLPAGGEVAERRWKRRARQEAGLTEEELQVREDALFRKIRETIDRPDIRGEPSEVAQKVSVAMGLSLDLPDHRRRGSSAGVGPVQWGDTKEVLPGVPAPLGYYMDAFGKGVEAMFGAVDEVSRLREQRSVRKRESPLLEDAADEMT